MINMKLYIRIYAYEKYKRGNACEYCRSIQDLEFAHIKPTKLKGMGRGKDRRAYDIKRNPDSYMLMCQKCHRAFDKGNMKTIIARQIKYLKGLGDKIE